jgi:hypothetical protein
MFTIHYKAGERKTSTKRNQDAQENISQQKPQQMMAKQKSCHKSNDL